MTRERHVTGGKQTRGQARDPILAEAKRYIRSLCEEESVDSNGECHNLEKEKNTV